MYPSNLVWFRALLTDSREGAVLRRQFGAIARPFFKFFFLLHRCDAIRSGPGLLVDPADVPVRGLT